MTRLRLWTVVLLGLATLIAFIYDVMMGRVLI